MSESKAKQHGGIKRLAQPGDIGRVFGWGYAGSDVAVLNLEMRDRTVVALEMPPLWACELFAEFGDREVMVKATAQGPTIQSVSEAIEEALS